MLRIRFFLSVLVSFTMVNFLRADLGEHGSTKKIQEAHTKSQATNSSNRLDTAMADLQKWVQSLEDRMPKEIENSAEKLLTLLDKPVELSSKLWDVLAQSEQQFEPEEKTVFGDKLEAFPLEERRKLVLAWTSKLQEFLRKRAVTLSQKLEQSSNPKAKDLAEAIRKLSQAHFQGYEEYKKLIKTSQDPKLFCFACDGHIGEFNYHENMEEQVKAALAGRNLTSVANAKPATPSGEKPKSESEGAGITPPGQGNFEKYRSTLVNGRPNPSMYPQPENMAPVIGLTSPDGFSYMKWKGEGQHFARGPQGNEWGVEIDWNLIKSQSLDEQKRVLGIFDKVLAAGVQTFKVVRPNNDGYCLWCNIANYGPSKAEMSALRARVR